jgi:hypothetical protein
MHRDPLQGMRHVPHPTLARSEHGPMASSLLAAVPARVA